MMLWADVFCLFELGVRVAYGSTPVLESYADGNRAVGVSIMVLASTGCIRFLKMTR